MMSHVTFDRRRCNDPRAGITKLELVAGLGVLVLLAQLVLPGINLAREATRRQTCITRMGDLVQGLHRYHDAHGSLPPGAYWDSEGLDLTNVIKQKPRPVTVSRQNWVQLTLPYLAAGEPLADRFDHTVSVAAEANRNARTTTFASLACPSDDYSRADNPYTLRLAAGGVAEFARGNYAINGGTHFIHEQPGWLANPRANGAQQTSDLQARTFAVWGNGVAGINRAYRFDDFENGLATLVAIDEVRAGIHPLDTRGVWSLGQIGASITWAHGINGDAYGPNNQRKNSDDIQDCGEVHRELGPAIVAQQRMPCCDYCIKNGQATSRSMHPGGVHTATLDGASRFISDDVDLGLWHVMHSRVTPESVLEEGLDYHLSGPRRSTPPPIAEAAEATAKLGASFTNTLGMKFVQIPAGSFQMGTPMTGAVGEHPAEAVEHPVRLTESYYLGIYEVTQAQYEAVTGANPSWYAPGGQGAADLNTEDTGDHPVENLSWDDAQRFCELLSALPDESKAGRTYRLPTEAEWEYACRSGSSEPYEFWNRWDNYDNSGEIAGKDWIDPPMTPWRVGTYEANPFGLYDMRGNVFEWTCDWYDATYYQNSPVDDPPGPGHGYLKVVRGIDWIFAGPACVYNYSMVPWMKSRFIGFRVVCEPEPRTVGWVANASR